MSYFSFLAQASRLALVAVLTIGSRLAAQAQILDYSAGATTNVASTYTDLGTSGTAIATANTDDANSAAQNIGFTFTYNRLPFTQFVLNTNGLLRLGANAPSSVAACSPYGQAPELGPINSPHPADVNLLLPFNFDLTAGTGPAEYRVCTSGKVGRRVCIIQWKNVADKALPISATNPLLSPTQFTNFSFQVKLYEASNQIEFVYGPAAAAARTAMKYATVGLKGVGNVHGQNVIALRQNGNAWCNTAFSSGPQMGLAVTLANNFCANTLPDTGRTYRFSACPLGSFATFPYSQDFEDATAPAVPCGTRVVDANNDNFTWATVPTLAGNWMAYYHNFANDTTRADDWFFTAALPLQTGLRYQLQFKYAAGLATYPEGLEVKIGHAATPAAQTITLFSNTSITNTVLTPTIAGTKRGQVASFALPAGVYYVGFHAISAADQYALYVDDVTITAATVTTVAATRNATPSFLADASPVPFGEQLTLHLNTTQAGPLELTLHDAVGRLVRQSSQAVPAGISALAVPEVGSLHAGMYLLTVRQGDNSQVIRVARE